MKNIYILFFSILLIITITSLSFYMGYSFYDTKNIEKKPIYTNEQNIKEDSENIPASKVSEAKITPSTKMVYQYYYEEDGKTEVLEEEPPYFLLDMTRQEIENDFNDWKVESFSNKEVIMKKTIKGKSNQHYILGEYNGFVAVFYEKEINGNNLKEITDTPLESLSEEDRKRLKEGIAIDGDDNLIKALENIES